MNCKPDQLCRVLRGEHANILVRTVERCGCLTDTMIRAMWTVELLQSALISGTQASAGTHVCMADRNLKPLGGEGKDPADKTVLDIPVPQTKKIVPIVPEVSTL